MAKTKSRRRQAKQRKARLDPAAEAARRERYRRRAQFDDLVATRERRQCHIVAACLVGLAALIVVTAKFSPGLPDAHAGRLNLLLVFVTGIIAGGLSCLAVQGGLLATAVAQREDLDPSKLREGTRQAKPTTRACLITTPNRSCGSLSPRRWLTRCWVRHWARSATSFSRARLREASFRSSRRCSWSQPRCTFCAFIPSSATWFYSRRRSSRGGSAATPRAEAPSHRRRSAR